VKYKVVTAKASTRTTRTLRGLYVAAGRAGLAAAMTVIRLRAVSSTPSSSVLCVFV
jgi:hypothetical protein